MPKRRDVVREQLEALTVDLEGLWVAVTADPKKEARKERIWTLFAGVLSAAAAMAARRTTAKAWTVLTGEPPPAPQAQQTQRRAA
jgi:hypothetical protein